MTETNSFPAWADVAAELIAVAARRAPADLVIRNCAWVNVHSREVIEGADIAIKAGRFASLRAGRERDDRGGDAGDRRGRALPDPGALRRAHARRERHARGQPVRAGGDAARHDDDVHRSARGGERARPAGRAADARRGDGAADQRLRGDAVLRPLGAGARDAGRGDRTRGRGRGDGLAGDRGPRRDDELSRRDRGRRQDAGGDRGDAEGGQDRGRALCQPGSHRLPGLCRRRAGRRPRGHARGGRDRAGAAGDAGDAAARVGLVRREGADHRGDREGARPAQLHPLHRRLPLGHAGERGPHGPGGAARHRLRARSAGGAADGDDQHRDAFRAWSASSGRSRRGGGRTAS